MDHPSHFHHQHQHQHARYAPLPPYQSRHSQFPEDPRLRPHHLLPPAAAAPTLPPPPPPPSLSYRTVRTPPLPHPHPYNSPHQSQFSFDAPSYAHRPVEEERSVSANHPNDLTHSQRVSNRMIIDNDRPGQSLPDFDYRNTDSRVGGWNPPRVLSDNRPSRSYPPIDFDGESHHQHSLNHKIAPPYPPIDKVRYISEGSSRGRVDHIDGYEVKTREEFAWGRGDDKYHRRRDFGSNLNVSSGDFGVLSSQSTLSRDLDSKNGDYVHYGVERDNEISRGRRRDGLGDSKRWVIDRKGPRDPHGSSFELGNNKNGGDGIRVTSGKYYGSELGRYSNRGNREAGQEFSRAPKKQIQKKSALLRIQMVKPNHKNREIEQLQYTSYGDDSNSNSFRNKDQFEYSGFGVKAQERDKSPVELDISFKSNSLVAKAIVAPSSSAISDVDITSVSDTDFAPAEKGKNGLASDSDSPDIKSAKSSMSAVNLGYSPCKMNCISSSSKEFNLQKKVSDSCSQLCASVTANCHVKNEGAQTSEGTVSHEITNSSSVKRSPRVIKKKKIVKKVVKKVVSNPNLNVSSSIPSNMNDGSMKADSVRPSFTSKSDKTGTSLKEKTTSVDKVSLPYNLLSSPEEGHLLPDNRKEDITLLSTGPHTSLQEHEADDKADTGQVDRIERSESSCNSSLGAFSIKDEKNDSDCPSADDFVHGLHSSPNTDKAAMAKSPNGIIFSDINNGDDVDMQLCQNEVSLSPQQYSNVQYLDNQFQLEDDKNSRLPTSAECVITSDVIKTCNSANFSLDCLSLNYLAGNAQKNISISDFGNDGKMDCKTKAFALSDTVILEENPETCSPVPSGGMDGFSGSAETRISDGQVCQKHSRVPMYVSVNSSTNLVENTVVPHSVMVKDSGKEASPVDVAASPENCTTEQSPNPDANFFIRFAEGDTNMCETRKVETCLKFSGPDIGGIYPDPIQTASLANVHTTLSLLKDSSVSEVSNPHVQSSDFFSRSSAVGVSVLHGNGEVSETVVCFGNSATNSTDRASSLSKINEVTTNHMNVPLLQAELSDAIVVATSCAEVPISISDNMTHQKEVAFSSMVKPSVSLSLAFPESSAKLYNSLFGGSVESVDANTNITKFGCSQLQRPAINCHSLEDLTIPNDQFPSLENEHEKNSLPVVPINNIQKDILVSGNTEREKIDIPDVEQFECGEFVERSHSADLESSGPQTKDDLPLEHQSLSCPADTDAVTSDCNTVSDVLSPGTIPDIFDSRTSDCEAIQNESIQGDEDNADSRSKVEQDCDLPASTLYSQYTTIKKIKSSPLARRDNLIIGKMMPQPLQIDSKVMTRGLSSSCSELNCGKNHSGSAIPTAFQGRSYLNFPKSKASAYSTHVSKLRTWHRTGNNSGSLPGNKPLAGTVPPNRSISEKKRSFENASYIRKGNNSIVRKHTSISASPQWSADQSSSLGFDEFQKSTGSEIMVEISNHTNLLKTGVTHSPMERQRTPLLPVDTKLPDHMATACEENKSSSLIEPLSNGLRDSACETKPRNCTEPCDAPNSADDGLKLNKTVENLTVSSSNVESQVEAHDENVPLNSKRIVYVKRKSNQLVASLNSCDVSVATDDNVQMASSDGYYKRSKNQLVRTTFESQIDQTVAMPAVGSDDHRARKASCNRRFGKRRSLKAVGRSCKPLRASLVWTLCGASSSKNDNGSLHHQKVLPHLFPWKRATYLRSFIYSPALSSNTNSLSAISKKLVLSRKRDAVYTRSTHGFSLRKSKVLGVGGYSLKWSKSIEKSSKRANEEATLAVAAVEKTKRERKDVSCISSREKRERIFRIGSVRYRMDSSGRTLQRISDDESLPSPSLRSGLHVKSSYIPRRLVIGNDEYVRIGNGHQLIRDPKKRTRILASEKIRWSLHTARQRLARRQNYCQFFTRFGKCNKDDRKCPYIHDPSKIAVCTKFLNGLCSTPNCKLTHKIIPERMPDCSYFLQGLCTNRNCPYRHVNVNPKASVCEGFLRGYCAEGNECRKKHTYVCPTFEATGICTRGTKCKLHHPQKQGKGKKRKRSIERRNCKRRYFGSLRIDVSEPGTMVVAPRQGEQDKDDVEGELADYISLDVDDEDVAKPTGQTNEQSTLCDGEPVDIVLDDEDELIKPVLIMK